MRNGSLGLALGALTLVGGGLTPATARGEDAAALFRGRVAPLLRERCLACHNGRKTRGGLNLASRASLLQGGEHGPAVRPGDAAHSLLLRLIAGSPPRMPKTGPPLTAEQVGDLLRWIDAGAPWPKTITLSETAPTAGSNWWSLRRLTRPAVPSVRQPSWVRTPVDAFILAALEAKGLEPSPPADRATLIRRMTFDLHGLPPTPAEVDAFLRDPRPEAVERLIDRLLASPRYGERWGRHWLDVAHYGDTHGYDKDKRRDHAWPYRDYVIRSFNEDRPYARFVRQQIAGDLLEPADPEGVIATGFVAAGPWDFVGHVELREGTVDKAKTRLLDRDDMLATTVTTFMSLTVGCARCHDHKFDPIPQKDYYRLQAVFAGVDRGDRVCEAPAVAVRRTALDRRRMALAAERPALVGALTDAKRAQLDTTTAEQAALDREVAKLPPPALVYALVPHAPRRIHLLRRGDVEQPSEPAHPGALSCVAALDPDFRLADSGDEGDRRAALAHWVADPRNPLTWRSIVNRVWLYHFGQGLVDTPSDFGRNGSRPSHPELLDWLACEFRDGGGSIKRLHRLILRSAAYQQASANRPALARLDADNRLLGRMNRRRLDAEAVRDSILAVSGKLDLRTGGPGFELFRFKDDHSPVYDHGAVEMVDRPASWRRTVYRFVVRSVPNPFLECLDCADPNINTPVRNTTLTALQALALLNDPFVVRQAEYFAERLQGMTPDPVRQVEEAYRLGFGRHPTAAEAIAVGAYARKYGLANACRLLFNANEFVFID
jgi:hypothetical protein